MDRLAQARALAYQSLRDLEAASDRLNEAEKLASGTAFAAERLRVEHQLEDAREAIMAAADRLEQRRRQREGRLDPRTLTERLVAGEVVEAPGAMEIAAFVDGYENEAEDGNWQRGVAEDVALWLLQQQPEAMAIVRSLVEEGQAGDPQRPVWLLDVANRRAE